MKAASPQARAGTDRWLVSYADLVTLLFAFFATLYASTLDSTRLAPAAASIQQAFATAPAAAARVTRTADATPAATPSSPDLFDRLSRALGDAIADHRLELLHDARGLVVSLPDDATFGVASADVTNEARTLIATVGDEIRSVPNAIRVEGHTDDRPIRTARYGSNWELSTARASSVVAFLVEIVGLEPNRLSAAGYGEFHPRVANATADGRARNRRVDLVILDATSAQPASSTDAAAR